MVNSENIDSMMIDLFSDNDRIMNISLNLFISRWFKSIDKKAHIVDGGCGMGYLIKKLQAAGFSNIRGLEINKEMAEKARVNTGIPIVQDDIKKIDNYFEKDSIDVLVLSDVLHHIDTVESVKEIMAKINSIVKKNGTIIIREPAPTIFTKIIRMMSKHRVFYFGPLKGRLTAYQMEDELLAYFFNTWSRQYKEIVGSSNLKIVHEFVGPMRQIVTIKKM